MEKVILRAWNLDDITILIKLIPQIDSRYLRRDFPKPYTKFDAQEFIDNSILMEEKDAGIYRAIIYNNEIIGNISLTRTVEKPEQATIGYYLLDCYKGRGIATKAVSLIINEVKSRYNLNEVIAFINEENVASRKVLFKNGFKFLQTLPKHLLDKETDVVGIYQKKF